MIVSVMVVLQISETIESCHEIVETKNRSLLTLFATVDPVYSKRGYSEYPLIVNGVLLIDR